MYTYQLGTPRDAHGRVFGEGGRHRPAQAGPEAARQQHPLVGQLAVELPDASGGFTPGLERQGTRRTGSTSGGDF